jgi:hypothetical protein
MSRRVEKPSCINVDGQGSATVTEKLTTELGVSWGGDEVAFKLKLTVVEINA